ncbi:MAG: hypothetical protein ACRC1H_02860, partial [Caldilineaceae bacterium]
NFGGGGGNIRTESGMNDKNRGDPMGPGGTGFKRNGRYNSLGGGKGGAGGGARPTGALARRLSPAFIQSLPPALRQFIMSYDPLSSIVPPSGADWVPSGPPIDTTIPRLGYDPTNGITGVKPGAIPPNTGSGYNPQWHDPNGTAFHNTTNINKNGQWMGSRDNGVGQSGWGSYGGRR